MVSKLLSVVLLLGLFSCNLTLADDLPNQKDILEQFRSGVNGKQPFGKDIADYFATRGADQSLNGCRELLSVAETQYREARVAGDFSRMQSLLKDQLSFSGTIPGLATLTNTCGKCVSRIWTEDGTYFSDGWCRIPEAAVDLRDRKLATAIQFLTDVSKYTKQKKGAYNAVLQFKPLDPADLKGQFPSPFTAQIAVDGFFYAFAYNASMEYLARLKEPVPHFVLQFKNTDKYELPKTVKDPVIQTRVLGVKPLRDGGGGWYADGENYHYFTSGNFGDFSVLDLKTTARNTLLEVLWNVQDIVSLLSQKEAEKENPL